MRSSKKSTSGSTWPCLVVKIECYAVLPPLVMYWQFLLMFYWCLDPTLIGIDQQWWALRGISDQCHDSESCIMCMNRKWRIWAQHAICKSWLRKWESQNSWSILWIYVYLLTSWGSSICMIPPSILSTISGVWSTVNGATSVPRMASSGSCAGTGLNLNNPLVGKVGSTFGLESGSQSWLSILSGGSEIIGVSSAWWTGSQRGISLSPGGISAEVTVHGFAGLGPGEIKLKNATWRWCEPTCFF